MLSKTFRNIVFAVTMLAPVSALAAPIQATLYKNPACDCCEDYAKYLDQSGFAVKVVPAPNLDALTQEAGVPTSMVGCHLTRIGNYVFEGHIPAPIIQKLLAEHLPIKGVAIAGMPGGLPGMPGMGGMSSGPINVYEVAGTATPVVFATVNPGQF